MAATTTIISLLLQPRPFKWKQTSPPIPLNDRHRHRHGRTLSDSLTLATILNSLPNPTLSAHCLLSKKPIHSGPVRAQTNPIEALARAVAKALEGLKNPAIAVVLVVRLLLMCTLGCGGSQWEDGREVVLVSFSFSLLLLFVSFFGFSSYRRSSGSSLRSYSVSNGSEFSCTASYIELKIVWTIMAMSAVALLLMDKYADSLIAATETASLLKVQVGLLGTGRTRQRDLDHIAQIADTSTHAGLRFILTETTLSLLQHPDYFISGYSSVDTTTAWTMWRNNLTNFLLKSEENLMKRRLSM